MPKKLKKMPETTPGVGGRNSFAIFDSSQANAPGTAVKIKFPTWGQQKQWLDMFNPEKMRDAAGDETLAQQQMDMQIEMMQDLILEWNWIDDDGLELPLPKDDPSVVERLTDAEIYFLAECLRSNQPNTKN